MGEYRAAVAEADGLLANHTAAWAAVWAQGGTELGQASSAAELGLFVICLWFWPPHPHAV